MITLCLKTDNPLAELYLYDDHALLAHEKWEAHRILAETLHAKIETILKNAQTDLQHIEKIIVFRGPGSFTGLRIGLSVANALGYAISVPVIGAEGEDWLSARYDPMTEFVPQMPLYGSDPHITQQKK